MAESAPDDGSPPREKEPAPEGSGSEPPPDEKPGPPTGAAGPTQPPPAKAAAPETPQERKAREFIAQAEKKLKSSQSFFGGLFR